MIDKILKDIKGLFKVQDKSKFFKQNITEGKSSMTKTDFKIRFMKRSVREVQKLN